MIEVIAELGINHNGDINIAKKLIDIAHSAGCHYIKFQKRCIESCYTEEELNTPRISPWGETTREQKEGLELSQQEYNEIDKYCKNKIPWFASPWDLKSLFLITQFKIPYVKIPSALLASEPFLEICESTVNKPLIISTGMSHLPMIDRAIEILGKDRICCIMHCTSTYPTATNELNLKCIPMFKERYPWAKIGFSNHHPGLIGMVVAAAYGAEMIEMHITLDRSMYGSDQAASIEPEGVFKICKYLRNIPDMLGDGNKSIYNSELPIIAKLRKMIV